MSNLSFQNIIAQLTNDGYKVNRFIVSEKGNYSQIDTDWNYKDILHLDNIHAANKSYIPCQIGKKSASYITFQKLPFIGIDMPLFMLVYEHSPFNHVHVSTIGPIIIASNIRINKNGKQTVVDNEYAIGTKGVFNFFSKLLKKLILRNNKQLFIEDISLRERRTQLREAGHDFIKQGETYDFDRSQNRNLNNVTLLKGTPSKVTASISEIIKNKPNNIGTNKGILSFFLIYNQKIQIWPTTCPHEGANIKKDFINNGQISCPWHGRKIKPIIELLYDGKIVSTNEQVYKIKKIQDNLEIFFNN